MITLRGMRATNVWMVFLFLNLNIPLGFADATLVDYSAIDPSINPCSDFYQYSCGNWLKRNTIPEDRSQWSRSFYSIYTANQEILRNILETSPSESLTKFYRSCLNATQASPETIDTFASLTATIRQIKSQHQIADTVGSLKMMGYSFLYKTYVDTDVNDATKNQLNLTQGGLILREKSFYLVDHEKNRTIRAALRQYLQTLFTLSGIPGAQAQAYADTVLRIETQIAQFSLSPAEERDIARYLKIQTLSKLQADAPDFAWTIYFQKMGYDLNSQDKIAVTGPEFFRSMGLLLTTEPLENIKTYLLGHLLVQTAGKMEQSWLDASFEFNKVLSGAKAQLPRWKTCVDSTAQALPTDLEKEYINRKFAGNSKAKALELIHNLESAMRDKINHSDWLDDPTRAEATRKLERIHPKIGYPDQWPTELLSDIGESYLLNALHVATTQSNHDAEEFRKPVDRGRWLMPAFLVNAYYDPLLNEIAFPAGILQPPFFSAEATAASNYGAIGMVIGHEITHGFDDQGRQFNADGSMVNWWSDQTLQLFTQRASCLVNQYSQFVEEGERLRGDQTLGENIADNGGIRISYLAYLKSQQNQVTPEQIQEFFLSFAQSWCTLMRPEAVRNQILTNVHSLPKYRVNVPLSNFTAFEQAFGCQPGSPMTPADRCSVW